METLGGGYLIPSNDSTVIVGPHNHHLLNKNTLIPALESDKDLDAIVTAVVTMNEELASEITWLSPKPTPVFGIGEGGLDIEMVWVSGIEPLWQPARMKKMFISDRCPPQSYRRSKMGISSCQS